MGSQIGLGLENKITFEPSTFLMHGGVRELADKVLNLSSLTPLSFIYGEGSSGKSHLISYLYFSLLEGGREKIYLLIGELPQKVEEGAIYFVDEGRLLLSGEERVSSGKWVALWEDLKIKNSVLFLFSSLALNQLEYDDHAMSRFRSGYLGELGAPLDSEIPLLFDRLLMQRGIKLKSADLRNIHTRLRRSTSSLVKIADQVMQDGKKAALKGS